MNVFKRITRATAAWLLAFSLFALASFTAITITLLNPTFIKETLVKTDVYAHIVPSVLTLATNVSYQQQPGEISNSQTLKDITPVIEKSITPAFLRSTSESIIDGTFTWLHAKTQWPTFSINIATVKAALTSNLTDYLTSRANALPLCSANTIPNSFDPLNATCRPNVTFTSDQFRQSALDFINSFPPLQQDTLQLDTKNVQTTFAKDKPISKAPTVYFWLTKMMYVFAALTLACAVTLFVVSTESFRTWRTIGHTLVVAGIMLVLTAVVTYLLLNRFGHQFIGNASKEQLEFVNTIFSPLSQELSKTLANVSLAFGVGYAVIGAACYGIAHKLELNAKRLQVDTSEQGNEPAKN